MHFFLTKTVIVLVFAVLAFSLNWPTQFCLIATKLKLSPNSKILHVTNQIVTKHKNGHFEQIPQLFYIFITTEIVMKLDHKL